MPEFEIRPRSLILREVSSMSLVDIVVIVAVLSVLVACVRSFRKGGSECSSCSSSAGCSAHATGGSCSVAQDMLEHVDAALDKRGGKAST